MHQLHEETSESDLARHSAKPLQAALHPNFLNFSSTLIQAFILTLQLHLIIISLPVFILTCQVLEDMIHARNPGAPRS